MDQTVQIVIIAALLVIVVLILTTSKNGRKFENAHKKGLYKTNLFIKIIDVLSILLLCLSVYLLLNGYIGLITGFILMAVFFICWLPFQFWSYTYVLLDNEGITYFSPSGKSANIPWKDVRLVNKDRLGLAVKSAKGTLRIYSFFAGFEKIKDTIKENCKGAF